MEEGLPTSRRASWRPAAGLTGLAAAPVLLVFAEHSRWEWLAPFLGRFHPVVLHFPVALLLLAALLEVLQLWQPGRWHFPLRLILGLAGLGATAAAALGWLLMRADGASGPLLERHLQGGIAVAILAELTLFLRLWAEGDTRRPRWLAYRGLLLATCLMLLRTAHDGGALTHGENYLDENAPWYTPPEREAFKFPTSQPVGQWDIYAHVVTPILEARCYDCHGARNIKGGLDLESYVALQKGGKNGSSIIAGNAEKSLLYERMNLPLEHQDHMPPRRHPQPSSEEMALVRRWINLGAPAQGTLGSLHLDNRLLAVVGKLPGLLQAKAVAEAEPEEIDPATLAKMRAALAPAVAQLQKRYPYILSYESRTSDELQLNATTLGQSFGDQDLAAFSAVKAKLARVDLSGTAITDRSAAVVAAMPALRILRLANTAITDAFAAPIGALENLQSLSIYGTGVTGAALPDLARLRQVKRIYVGRTKISIEAQVPAPLQGKLVDVTAVAPIVHPPVAPLSSPGERELATSPGKNLL